MIREFTAAQNQSIEYLQVLRMARQSAIDAKSAIGPIAVRNALAPLRELIDAATDLDYPASHALATALAGRDARDCTVRGLLSLIERIPA